MACDFLKLNIIIGTMLLPKLSSLILMFFVMVCHPVQPRKLSGVYFGFCFTVPSSMGGTSAVGVRVLSQIIMTFVGASKTLSHLPLAQNPIASCHYFLRCISSLSWIIFIPSRSGLSSRFYCY